MATVVVLDRREQKTSRGSRTGGGNEMIRSLSRLFSLDRIQKASGFGVSRISTLVNPLQFRASPALWSEPLKKKRKIDPGLVKMREEKKKKRILKEIRKLQKLDRELKPLAEYEIPLSLRTDLERRQRTIEIPNDVAEKRILLLKEWSRVKFRESKQDSKTLSKLIRAQQKALDELRIESEELYQAAVKIDSNLIPFKYTGPPETPPKQDYRIPDGSYIDVSRKWE